MGLWLIAKSNIKRKKGNAVILFFLVMLSTLLFYSGFNVLKNIGHFLDEKQENGNGAQVMMATSLGEQDKIEGILKEIDGYKGHETETALIAYNVVGEINKADNDEDADTMAFIFLNDSTERTISDWPVQDEAEKFEEDSIILPMYLKVAKGFKSGDKIYIKYADNSYTFKIAGFVEDVMFATPSNISTYKCYISDERYQDLKENESALAESRIYNVLLDDVTQSEDYEKALGKQLTDQMDESFFTHYLVNYNLMRMATAMMTNILMAIIEVFSILLLMVAVVVIRFNIVATMEENLPNIGILQALGYTSRQLQRTIVLEYMLITVSGIVTGLLCSGVFANVLTTIISSSVGLDWKAGTDYVAAFVTVAVISVLVLIAIRMAARRYNKITTLDALRDGIVTHNFKRNFIPLHKSAFSVNSSLGLKGLLQGGKQNITMTFVVILLSFTMVIMFLMYSNFAYDNEALINLVGIEKTDIMMVLPEKKLHKVKSELEKDTEIDMVLAAGTFGCKFIQGENEATVSIDVYDDVSKCRLDTLLEGRLPKWDNEIVITNVVAKQLEVELGDSITLKMGDNQENYVIVGIGQQISNMGQRAMIEEKAMKRLVPSFQCNTLYIYLKDAEKIKAKVSELTETYKADKEINISNFEENYNTMMGTYTTSVGGLTVILVLITLAVISLILFLLVRMKLIRERKLMGVFKAIGYTTPQLMGQMVLSFIPIVTVGVILGSVAAAFSLNKLFALCLSVNGVENCNMNINIWVILITFAVLVLQSLIMVIITSWRIRKIEPYKMITE